MSNTPRINAFVEYCLSFYGPGQIYDIGATEKDVLHALAGRLISRPDLAFEGDSTDRELVRDVMIESKAA